MCTARRNEHPESGRSQRSNSSVMFRPVYSWLFCLSPARRHLRGAPRVPGGQDRLYPGPISARGCLDHLWSLAGLRGYGPLDHWARMRARGLLTERNHQRHDWLAGALVAYGAVLFLENHACKTPSLHGAHGERCRFCTSATPRGEVTLEVRPFVSPRRGYAGIHATAPAGASTHGLADLPPLQHHGREKQSSQERQSSPAIAKRKPL